MHKPGPERLARLFYLVLRLLRSVTDSDGQDCLGQLCVAGLQVRQLLADVVQGAFQLHTTDFAVAGDEAGGVVAGGTDDFVIAKGGGHIGGGIGGCGHGANEGIGGDDEAGRLCGRGQSQQQGGAKQAGTEHDRSPG